MQQITEKFNSFDSNLKLLDISKTLSMKTYFQYTTSIMSNKTVVLVCENNTTSQLVFVLNGFPTYKYMFIYGDELLFITDTDMLSHHLMKNLIGNNGKQIGDCPVCFENLTNDKDICYESCAACGNGMCRKCFNNVDKCPFCRKAFKKIISFRA